MSELSENTLCDRRIPLGSRTTVVGDCFEDSIVYEISSGSAENTLTRVEDAQLHANRLALDNVEGGQQHARRQGVRQFL